MLSSYEYSYWACNFYVGCSNGCEYCYLKKGRGAKILGGDEATLKACFKSREHALEVFEKELLQNLTELQKHGLFFSFTTDPMIISTRSLTLKAIDIATNHGVPCKVLTKNANTSNWYIPVTVKNELVAFGFTLTGHDELEPNASPNSQRIERMKKLHNNGFKTFASIEPIIDFESSLEMILSISAADGICCCDLLKIGLESGKKYNKEDLQLFVNNVIGFSNSKTKIYFKDTLLSQAGINRGDLPVYCVGRDYNLFNK